MNFEAILQRRGIRFHRSTNDPSEIQICCLFCQDRGESEDKRFRLGINVYKNAGRCFNCDWRSRYAITAVLRKLQISPSEYPSGYQPVPDTVINDPVLPEGFMPLVKTYDELDIRARNYLLQRGITPRQIQDTGVGVCYSGRYAYRIVFPVTVNRHLKMLVARAFTNQEPKYLNSLGVKCLYRFDPMKETCILSEGIFKALRIAQVTDYGSSAVLGHDLTEFQLDQIQESRCRRIIVWPDPDRVGYRGAVTIADKLTDTWSGTVEVLDPGEFSADEVPRSILKTQLQTASKYSWAERQRILLKIS